MNLTTAKKYADKICEWIAPYCAQPPLIAGSIRRERPECNDVDIVCIPKIVEARDLLGQVVERENLLLRKLRLEVLAGKGKFISGGEREGKQVIFQLRACQLDLWFATPETMATRLLCRTGSMQHNIWLASRAKRLGRKWNPYEGILAAGEWGGDEYVGGHVQDGATTEKELYALLGLPFIEPRNRELAWLEKNYGQQT